MVCCFWLNALIGFESLPKNTSRRRSMICLLKMKGHGCCAPFLLADPSLWLRYPSAHLLTTKQFTGLFCLTSKALLGFKSLPITKNNLHTIRYVGCFGADEDETKQKQSGELFLPLRVPSKEIERKRRLICF